MYTGRRSIINVFVTFGIFAILLVTITYLFIFRVMSDERAAQDRLFFKVSSSNNILVDIENCRSAITQYRHAWESKYLELYLSSIEKINSDVRIYLSETDSFSYENIQSVRRLSNFLAYQSSFDLSPDGDRAQLYSCVSYILDAFDSHQKEIYTVMQADMNDGYSSYIDSAAASNRQMIAGLVGFLFFTVVLGGTFVIYQRKMIAFIRKMQDNLAQISRQNWDTEDLRNNSFAEFNELSSSINLMKLRLHDYFMKIQEQNEIEKKLAEERLRNEQQRTQMIEAEMTILKSQVNPHFLFNALHQIGMASLITGPDVIMNLVESTGRILRYYLDNSDRMVMLSEELEIVKTYVGFQRQTTDIPFGFSLSVEDGLEDVPVLPMCIQPLVENSFKYGFQKKADDWELRITCFRCDDFIRVSIFDNGPGLDTSAIKESKGIGMANIRKRLSLQYSRDDLMMINSRIGEYTEVIISFPVKEDS